MRLYTYLNEVSEVPNELIDTILNNGFNRFNSALSKLKFRPWVLLFAAIQKAFEPYDVGFVPQGKILNWFIKVDYVGATSPTNKGEISIPITLKRLRRLKNKADQEDYKSYIRQTLAHELVHRHQFTKASEKYRRNFSMTKDDVLEYFDRKSEIEAYARGAVVDLERGNTGILDVYLDEYMDELKENSWRRFLKKVCQYLDMYGSDKAKKNFKDYIEDLGGKVFSSYKEIEED